MEIHNDTIRNAQVYEYRLTASFSITLKNMFSLYGLNPTNNPPFNFYSNLPSLSSHFSKETKFPLLL